MAETDAVVAIYWDFENVHACLIDDGAGEQTYRTTARNRPQEVVIDVARVAEYAASYGRVAVHRAYANWQFFGKYAAQLQAHAIDLVQLFPLTSSKNGADIRLALDVIDDLRLHPRITHVVVVGSDSDYTALAQRCRAYGIGFVGVGTARTAPGYPAACDEFRRYHELPPAPRFVPAVLPAAASLTAASLTAASLTTARITPVPVTAAGALSFDAAADLVEQAIRRVAAETGASSPWVLKAAVRPMVKRLDPGFEEPALGFAAFSDLVTALGRRVVERAGIFDHELAVRADLPVDALVDSAYAGSAAGLAAVGPFGPSAAAVRIEGLLRRKNQRLPADKQLLWTGTGLVAEIFAAAPDRIVASFDHLRAELETAGAEIGIAVPEPEFRKLKAILWRAHAFEPLGYALGLRLREPDATALRLRMVTALLRLLPSRAEADPSALAEAIFGPAATAAQQDLIGAALLSLAQHPEAGADADADAAGSMVSGEEDRSEEDCSGGDRSGGDRSEEVCSGGDRSAEDCSEAAGCRTEPSDWESAA
jgi:hypothetical protein